MVVESVQKAVEESLLNCNESRTYFTQALLPVPVSLDGDEEEEKRRNKRGSTGIDVAKGVSIFLCHTLFQ